MAGEYKQHYTQFQRDPGQFWLEQSKRIPWFNVPTEPYQYDKNDFYHWFADGKLNTCYLALDQHVEAGFAEQTALIYDSPVTNTKQQYSYGELQTQVAQFAGLQILWAVHLYLVEQELQPTSRRLNLDLQQVES